MKIQSSNKSSSVIVVTVFFSDIQIWVKSVHDRKKKDKFIFIFHIHHNDQAIKKN